MTTHRMSLFGLLQPDTTGNAFLQPFDLVATNDVWKHPVLMLKDAAADCGVFLGFTIPKNYVGSAKIVTVYSSTGTSGNAYLGVTYRAVGGDDTESLDQTGSQEAVTPTAAAAPSAAHERKEHNLTLTAANLAVDDFVEAFVFRDNDNGSETLAADVIVHDLLFEYADA